MTSTAELASVNCRDSSFYEQIALLHMEGIDRGFLRQLGAGFLTLLYEAIDLTPSGVLISEVKDGRVAGFVSGSASMKPLYKSLLRKPFRLFFALLPSLLVPARLKRMVEILRYSRNPHVSAQSDLPSFELLSIVVSPEFRGTGCAESLYRSLEEYCRVNSISEFKIVVGDDLLTAHRFYQRMGAVAVGHTEVHRGAGSAIYVQRVA